MIRIFWLLGLRQVPKTNSSTSSRLRQPGSLQRPDVFSEPRLEISNAELSSKVEIAGRVSCTMDNFLHVARSVCGIELTSCIVTRVLFHLVDLRGHLLLSVRPRSAYSLGEATADLEAYLQDMD